jgi:hypothetical protein
MLSIVLFLVSLLCSVASANRLARSIPERIIISSLVFFAPIVLVGSVLGVCGALSPVWWLWLSTATHLLVYCGARCITVSAPPLSRFAYPGHLPILLVGCLTILVLVSCIVVGAFEPANIDDFDYHFAKIFYWLSEHTFAPTGLELLDGYPQNGELIAAYLGTVLGAVNFADGFQLLALPLWCAAVFRLARQQGVGESNSLLVAVLSCFFPGFWSLVTTVHVDILASALLLTALALLFDRDAFSERVRLILIGSFLGLLVGTKYVALPWVGILGIAACIAPGRPRSIAAWISLVLPCLVLGGERYVSNLIQTGNPLYPYTIPFLMLETVENPRILSELWEERMAGDTSVPFRVMWSWFSPAAMSQTNHENWFGGFGLLWPLVFASSLWATVVAVRQQDRTFLWLVFMAVALFLPTPAHFATRFVLFLPAIGVVGFGKVLEQSRSEWARRVLLILALLAALHCMRQHLTLLLQELGPRRGTSIVTSCSHVARPEGLRDLFQPPLVQTLRSAQQIHMVRGVAPVDRLVSYGCLWAAAPSAQIRFYEFEALPEAIARSSAIGPGALLLINSKAPAHQGLEEAGWVAVLKIGSVVLLQPPNNPAG